MTDEEYLNAWAAERNISAAAMDKLTADGFTSMEAMKLVETSDLSRNKNHPRTTEANHGFSSGHE